ncbi:MAG: CHAD domain-containing protein, partial [Calditerrivibrio sp.]|nr:CHAD domain-containing protein [Calditerrivibrio sp.]MCA1933037.1 CHAD domain-containing protein [Calditerrivibrio sp.]
MFKIYITEQLKLIDELGLLIVSSDRLRNDDTLHDFRVALRRFLSIFNIVIKNTEPDPMIIEHLTVLKQIRKETNRLRDLEVLSDILKGKKIDGEFGSKGENELLSYINKLAEKELENILA